MSEKDVGLEQFVSPLKKGEVGLPEGHKPPADHEDRDSFTTVRETTHQGKKIEIHTTYRILIDGEPLRVHTMVGHDGKVHNHSLPQYSFTSTVDMVRKLIDTFDVELPEDQLGTYHEHGQGED